VSAISGIGRRRARALTDWLAAWSWPHSVSSPARRFLGYGPNGLISMIQLTAGPHGILLLRITRPIRVMQAMDFELRLRGAFHVHDYVLFQLQPPPGFQAPRSLRVPSSIGYLHGSIRPSIHPQTITTVPFTVQLSLRPRSLLESKSNHARQRRAATGKRWTAAIPTGDVAPAGHRARDRGALRRDHPRALRLDVLGDAPPPPPPAARRRPLRPPAPARPPGR
jgi:hypothetical protein